MNGFFRFPHTPHLAWLGKGDARGDKVLSPGDVEELLSHEVIVEEKLDGANVGLSRGDDGGIVLQNRGAYLSQPYRGQFTRLTSWLGEKAEPLNSAITPETILFGEWCAATHSLFYERLPDWFLLFDVYCRRKRQFWSAARRNELAQRIGICTVPEITRGRFTLSQLTELLLDRHSDFRDGAVEGLIIRREDEASCVARAKLVRPDFSQAIHKHWSSRPLSWNRLMLPSTT